MALPVNTDDLIYGRLIEPERIEFFRKWNPEEVLKTVCAFANDIHEQGSGYIVIGVDKKNGTPVLPPAGIPKEQLKTIRKEFTNLCHRINPKLFPDIVCDEIKDKHVTIIWVTAGEEKPYSAPSAIGNFSPYKIYVRHEGSTEVASRVMENRLREQASFSHFDNRVNPKATVEDLDLGLIQAYLQETKSCFYPHTLKLPLNEIATKLQIAQQEKEKLQLLNIALLLFCKEPHRLLEGCRTTLIEYEDEDGIHFSEKQFTGPVHIQIREIMNYLNTNVIKEFGNRSSGNNETQRFENYPYQALEEAVVNAFEHKSYDHSSPVEINIYKGLPRIHPHTEDHRRITIVNRPGPLPFVDEMALSQGEVKPRYYRNIRLGDFLKNIHLTGKNGSGLPAMREALRKNGSPQPRFVTDAEQTYFEVAFPINHQAPVEITESTEEAERVMLTHIQQTILEKLIHEPCSEKEIIQNITSGLKEEVEALIQRNLISEKKYGDYNFLHITPQGIDLLRQTFP